MDFFFPLGTKGRHHCCLTQCEDFWFFFLNKGSPGLFWVWSPPFHPSHPSSAEIIGGCHHVQPYIPHWCLSVHVGNDYKSHAFELSKAEDGLACYMFPGTRGEALASGVEDQSQGLMLVPGLPVRMSSIFATTCCALSRLKHIGGLNFRTFLPGPSVLSKM